MSSRALLSQCPARYEEELVPSDETTLQRNNWRRDRHEKSAKQQFLRLCNYGLIERGSALGSRFSISCCNPPSACAQYWRGDNLGFHLWGHELGSVELIYVLNFRGMKAAIRSYLPRPVWNALAQTKYFAFDTLDTVLGRRDSMTPPRSMVFIGSGDFRKIGEEFLGYFQDLCGLRPEENVLDVGCGIGRMAIPLTGYLAGRYEGFDIVKSGIDWCSNNITPKFWNFNFQLADIFNQEYNPTGKFKASEYRFPFSDHSFDFVFLTSVFTHMLPEEVSNYLREIRRVLKPDGRCLITWLLLNEHSETLISTGKSSLSVIYPMYGCKVANISVPEDAIAYPEDMMKALYLGAGFEISDIHFGSWCGRNGMSYQDIVVAR